MGEEFVVTFDIIKLECMLKDSSNRRCIFCGSKKLSNEHIYSQWLFQLLNIESPTFKPGNFLTVVESTNFTDTFFANHAFNDNREIRYQDFKAKRVCEECNNGWMSVLEEQTKKVVEKIFEDVSYRINSAEAFSLSRWAILKTILIGYAVSQDAQFFFDQFILEMLKEGIIPEGFIVEYRKMESRFLNYHFGNLVPIQATRISKEQIELAADNFFVGGLHIGNVAFRVSYLRTSIPVQRIQINERIKLLFPYEAKLPYIGVDLQEDSIAISKDEELMGLCNSLTLCDTIC